jgi:hypothetical protein
MYRFDQWFYIVGMYVEITGDSGSAGIARRRVEFFDFGALFDFPGQGMLSGPTANNQYFQYGVLT